MSCLGRDFEQNPFSSIRFPGYLIPLEMSTSNQRSSRCRETHFMALVTRHYPRPDIFSLHANEQPRFPVVLNDKEKRLDPAGTRESHAVQPRGTSQAVSK